MLTFVNGFKAAAGGNFIEALKLNQIMKLSTTQAQVTAQLDSDTPNDPLIVKIVIAEMLAIFFLGITVTMMLIMLVYLIARIVGLWIALILSPLALFATALPPFLAPKVSGVTGDYWTKLGALLSGGPMMAFFLWLTMATVQGEGFGTFTSTDAAQQAEIAGVFSGDSGFATAVGNVEDVATFFVAIIMLLMGIKAAVDVSASIAPAAGKLAGKIKDVGVKGAKFAAYGGLAMAGAGAASGVYRAGRFTGRTVGGAAGRGLDRRLDITGKGGRFMQRAGATLGSTALMGAGAKMAGVRPGRRKMLGEKMEKGMANMNMPDRLNQLEKLASSRDRDKAQAAQLQLAKLVSTTDGIGAKSTQFEAEAKAKGIEGEAEQRAYAEVRAREYTGQQLDILEGHAKETHDEDTLKLVRERKEPRPDFIQDDEALHKRVTSMADDGVREFKKTVKSQAYQDSRVWDSLFRSTDALNADGSVNEENEFAKELLNSGGTASIIGKQRLEALNKAAMDAGFTREDAEGNVTGNAKAFLEDRDAFAASGLAGTFYARGKAGKYDSVSREVIKTGGVQTGSASRVERRPGEINAGRQRVERRRAELADHRRNRGLAPNENDETTRAAQVEMGRMQYDVMQAGGSLREATGADAQGTFANKDDARAFSVAVTEMHEAGDTDVSVYNSLDVDALNANPNKVNEARSRFVQATNVDQVKKSYERAERAGDARSLRSVANVARTIDTEGSRVQQMINRKNSDTKKYNKGAVKAGRQSKDEVVVDDVIEAAKKNDQAALKKALGDSGLVMDMNDAQALMKQKAVKDDEVLRTYTRHASSRTGSALRSVGKEKPARDTGERDAQKKAERVNRMTKKLEDKAAVRENMDEAAGRRTTPEVEPAVRPNPDEQTPPTGGGKGGGTAT